MTGPLRIRAPRHRRRQRGLALVMVLWTVVLLALIAAAFLTESRSGAVAVRNELEAAKAEALADAGAAWAVRELLARQQGAAGEEPGEQGGDLQALLRRRPELETVLERRFGVEDVVAAPLAEGGGWAGDGRVHAWRYGGADLLVSAQDEGGKVDLNAAADELLRGLLRSAGLAPGRADELLAAVADFRDGDDLRRPGGAEDPDYAAAGRRRGAKDAPFEAVSELRRVLGMTPELYAALAPALTVHSGQPGINPHTAPRAALLALPGASAGQIDAFLATRGRGIEQGARDVPNLGELATRSRSRTYTVRSEAYPEAGGAFVREAVVELAGGAGRPYQVLEWRRGRRAALAPDEGPEAGE